MLRFGGMIEDDLLPRDGILNEMVSVREYCCKRDSLCLFPLSGWTSKHFDNVLEV